MHEICGEEGFARLPAIVEAIMDILLGDNEISAWLLPSLDIYSDLLGDLREAVSALTAADGSRSIDILLRADVKEKCGSV